MLGARRLSGAETNNDSDRLGRLRTALRVAATTTDDARDFAAREVDRAAEPLIESLYQPLFRYCRRLLQGSSLLRDRVEPEDLAQDAWLKMLRYLCEPTGDNITGDKHFQNALYRVVLTLFQDRLDRYTRAGVTLVQTVDLDAPLNRMGDDPSANETRGDRLAASDTRRADRTLILGDDCHSDLIALLFRDERAFREASQGRVRRSLSRYRGFVLLQLGLYLTEELVAGTVTDAGELRLLRAYVGELGVPPEWWQPVEAAAWAVAGGRQNLDVGTTEDALASLLPVVNRVCDVELKAGNGLSVLRYELNAFVGNGALRKESGRK